jgi:4-hydroxy-3-methylbut-2-enyl diphosphate reductase
MKIITADKCGFCFGSRRSVEMASKAGKAYSLGPLLHNEILVEELRAKGIEPKSYDEILREKPCKVVIRAHGVPVQQIDCLRNRGYEIIDTTCTKIQEIYRITTEHEKAGYEVVILGEKDHPEVIGIVSRLGSSEVVSGENEIRQSYGKVCLVSQTTQRNDAYEKLRDALEERCIDLRAFNTICCATHERQNSARSLAKKVCAMIVIGGRTSSNTKRLYEICRHENPNSYLVQSKQDLEKELFISAEKIGIIAGASTPDSVIASVVRELELFSHPS